MEGRVELVLWRRGLETLLTPDLGVLGTTGGAKRGDCPKEQVSKGRQSGNMEEHEAHMKRERTYMQT